MYVVGGNSPVRAGKGGKLAWNLGVG